VDVDWAEDEDVLLRILRTLRRAYPEATREQLIIAIKRAQTEIDLRITAVNGHNGQTLGEARAHARAHEGSLMLFGRRNPEC
jgi:hypothetical protein